MADCLKKQDRLGPDNTELGKIEKSQIASCEMVESPAPFACTTNFGTHLDPATLRRFVFKITLDYLAPEQAEAAAFRGYFGLEPEAGVVAFAALTPGDFAVVRRKAEVLDCLREPEALAAMLRAECDAKPDCPQATGFRP